MALIVRNRRNNLHIREEEILLYDEHNSNIDFPIIQFTGLNVYRRHRKRDQSSNRIDISFYSIV